MAAPPIPLDGYRVKRQGLPKRAQSAARRWGGVGWASVRECHMSVRWRERKVGGVEMVLLDALAPGGRLASFSDSLEIFRV